MHVVLAGSVVMVFFTRRWLWVWPVLSIVCTIVGFLSGLDLTFKSTEWTGCSAPRARHTTASYPLQV
ncbi:hypothetical protein [Mycolicibacterium sp. HK-90]|uniref:hypothetical protein n=1 Tax=Mycolicibacterium sp. HK-90 TaxID=3056937 RepID=UPI002657C47F|nr:hypothetical protein [Mycolicibacterium sp. HK-90]WKG03763.1 hypothetical protein QU592_01010 [Mycolicibacterium sp. HK-90]